MNKLSINIIVRILEKTTLVFIRASTEVIKNIWKFTFLVQITDWTPFILMLLTSVSTIWHMSGVDLIQNGKRCRSWWDDYDLCFGARCWHGKSFTFDITMFVQKYTELAWWKTRLMVEMTSCSLQCLVKIMVLRYSCHKIVKIIMRWQW